MSVQFDELRHCQIRYYEDGNEIETTGLFHCWGFAAKADPDLGNIQWSVAIVEIQDGNVVGVDPTKIKFLDRSKHAKRKSKGGETKSGSDAASNRQG